MDFDIYSWYYNPHGIVQNDSDNDRYISIHFDITMHLTHMTEQLIFTCRDAGLYCLTSKYLLELSVISYTIRYTGYQDNNRYRRE